jgi:hypothetical protein
VGKRSEHSYGPPPAGCSACAWASALWARRGAWGPSSSKNAWEQHGWCWPRGKSEHSGSHEALSSLGLSAGRVGVWGIRRGRLWFSEVCWAAGRVLLEGGALSGVVGGGLGTGGWVPLARLRWRRGCAALVKLQAQSREAGSLPLATRARSRTKE